MRLWHKDLISYLPKQQLLGQWKECCGIASNIVSKGTPNHILVNKILNYPLGHFYSYGILVKTEMIRRGYKCDFSKFSKYFQLPENERYYNISDIFSEWHNGRYFKQCYHNLQEKYDCGGLTEEEWIAINKSYSFVDCEDKNKMKEELYMPINKGKDCICISGYLLWDTSESELLLKQKDEDDDFYYTNPLINIINDYIEYDSKDLGDGSLPKTIKRDDEGLGTKTMTVPNCSIYAYFTETECTTEDATQEFLGFMYGGEYYTHGRYVGYSEWTITGFCVDTFTIGGHDLIKELKEHDGQYVNMIIEF